MPPRGAKQPIGEGGGTSQRIRQGTFADTPSFVARMRARALPHPYGVTSSTCTLYPRSLTRSFWQKSLANSAARSRPYFPDRLLRSWGRQPALGTAPSCPCGGGVTGYGVYNYNSELYNRKLFTFTTVNNVEFTFTTSKGWCDKDAATPSEPVK